MAFGEETFKRALREGLASRDIVGLPYLFNVDSVFVGFKRSGWGTLGVRIPGVAVNASEYWTTSGLRCPSDAGEVSVWTRRVFRYPKATVIAKLPPPEVGAYYYPIVLFSMASSEINGPIELHSWDGADYDLLVAGAWKVNVPTSVVLVQGVLPSDYATSYHTYTLEVHRWGAELFIDGRLRAVAIAVQSDVRYQLNNTLPYSVGVGYATVGSEYVFGIRVGNVGADPSTWRERLLPISPHYVAVGDGDPLPPRALHMYVPGTDTRLAGRSITSGSITSHPMPMYGYNRKTLRFMASSGGSLEVQVLTLTGNWRTYDSISIPADTLLSYTVEDVIVLARVVFTPSAYPATILEAEVSMS